MILNKFLFTLTLLLLFSTSLNAHGPSRQKVSEKIQINADVNKVWNVVKNFKEFKWNNDIKSCSANENSIGSERIIEFTNGSKVKQKLEKLDAYSMAANFDPKCGKSSNEFSFFSSLEKGDAKNMRNKVLFCVK